MTARLVAVIAGLMLAVAPHAPASAHTELELTLPADEASVVEPVREVTVAFTDRVTLVGPGFEVLDSQGVVVAPFVVTDDDTLFRLLLEPPLGRGEVAVRYEVRARDGHTIAGGFSFTVSADAPVTDTAIATTEDAAAIAPTTTSPSMPVSEHSDVVGHSSATADPVPDQRVVAHEPVSGHRPLGTAARASAAVSPERGPGIDSASAGGGGEPTMAVVGMAAVVAAVGARLRWLTTRPGPGR